MKNTALLVMLTTLTIPTLTQAKNDGKTNAKAFGFECASEYLNIIPMLGRGEDFPDFLARDIETELRRQNKGSKLISVKCDGAPELQASHNMINENEIEQKVVSKLSFTIPLQVIVKNGKREMTLQVNQNYFVENLDKPGQQKTTQNFIVKK